MEMPTQFSYETFSDKNSTNSFLSPDLIFEINELNNNRKKKIENVFDEVNQIKKKKLEKEINYVDALIITDSEYERSVQDMNKISDMLTEEHIVEMISTRKLFFVYKHILEIFALLIGEGYFEWSHFRTKLNIHEIRYRMINCNLNIFSKNKINEYLNKIYKTKKLTDEYLKNDNSGIGVIFKWIKAALKVCLYKLQMKKNHPNLIKINDEGGMDNTIMNHHNTNYNTKDKMTKFSKVSGTLNNKFLGSTSATLAQYTNSNLGNFVITNYKEPNDTDEKINKIKSNSIGGNPNPGSGSGFYLTSLNNNNKNALPNISHPNGTNNRGNYNNNIYNCSDTTIKEEEHDNTPNLKKKNIPIIKRICHKRDIGSEFFQNLENSREFASKNRLIEKYNISSLPLLKFKTYHQLKRFFKSSSPKKARPAASTNAYFDNSNGSIIPNDIDKFSLRNPKNYEKIVNLLSLGKLKGIDDETFSMFVENLKMDDYFNNQKN